MDKITDELIHARLAEAIKYSGLSKAAIAEKLGVSNSIVSRYCNTMTFPALDTFARLCKILDVSADDILGLGE